jgi:hypothetical protein
MLHSIMLGAVMLNVASAECHHADSRGAVKNDSRSIL